MIFIGLNMLRKYIADFEPDDCCIVWDGGHDSRRKKLFPQYKRKKKRELTEAEEREKDAFFQQLREFQKVLNSFEIPQIRCKGREADDVIYNIVAHTKLDIEFILVSTDRDFYQLLDCPKNVRIYSPGKKKEIGVKDVEKEFGIPIEHYVEYKAMVGDPSDNLPGIMGVGPVAAKWLVNNVICFEGVGKIITEADKRRIQLLYDNMDRLKLMEELIKFMAIDSKEIEDGKFGSRTHAMAGYQERILWALEEYGFDRFLDKFEWFFSPFEILWRKNEKSDFWRSA
jgi:DNA polymerase-1